MSISAMKQALEALDCINSPLHVREMRKLGEAMRTLRQAIAEAEKQEPVAWFIQYEYRHEFLWREPTAYEKNSALEIKPLYTSPVHAIDISQEHVDETAKDKHEWVGLTHEERDEIDQTCRSQMQALFAIEAKLKEKNCG